MSIGNAGQLSPEEVADSFLADDAAEAGAAEAGASETAEADAAEAEAGAAQRWSAFGEGAPKEKASGAAAHSTGAATAIGRRLWLNVEAVSTTSASASACGSGGSKPRSRSLSRFSRTFFARLSS